MANVGESGESVQNMLANVGESGEFVQNRLANVGKSGKFVQHGFVNVCESEQTRLANVSEFSESDTFSKGLFWRVLKFDKFAGEWPFLK